MMDTQWPRWEVFKQDTLKKPHQAIGTVHAADSETALLEARNVFVRRPKAVSLWVAPAEAVFSMTRQELEKVTSWDENIPESASEQTYLVFCKQNQRRSMSFVDHVGEVQARSAKGAMETAVSTLNDNDHPGWVWWVVPQSAITRSQETDIESWFTLAHTKTYRLQSKYGTVKLR